MAMQGEITRVTDVSVYHCDLFITDASVAVYNLCTDWQRLL